jgi:hypothetical protein
VCVDKCESEEDDGGQLEKKAGQIAQHQHEEDKQRSQVSKLG